LRNRREKKDLVEQGRAHGILVYAKGQPVGWCRYEPESRAVANRQLTTLSSVVARREHKESLEITWFVTDKKHRRRGVASAALNAALESIQEKGGGVVEAYQIIPWEKLRRARIRRCGHAPAFGNQSTHGTLSTFQKQGFQGVGP
jgi:ribosomal protein S18 acetylase RimI-like enzyme